ncbi:hypothetical protein K493DRAFT_310206 [Basidiobolus meristosporus CBS 931.73]|uniref:Uncharacterized protein n=1 Tax=Basidiobolus meristosporus CBS 931.73 TaxID=1314790 RepID=A0A1Y1ZB32_9FUNG|nr:hypothetical protein K493DRAFT_310206 [Basidiobolus meristosporus CBS 931.73]|eukprot:ORY07470.1 hypothetical protein K493DRAFT_310206 [Basidiobolus meristosporus CBS 931.73]
MQVHSVHRAQGNIEKDVSLEIDPNNHLASLADAIKKLQAETNDYLTGLMKNVGTPDDHLEEKEEDEEAEEEVEEEEEEESSSPDKKKLRVKEN